MPFHIFTSQWFSTFTGGLEVWKIWKDLLLFLAVLVCLLLVYIKNGFKDKFFWLISGLGVLYVAVHLLIWALNPDIEKGPALLATVYNCRLFGYLIVGFTTGILFKDRISPKKVFKIVIILSTVVCLIALLQWFLPKDVMTHFGYSVERGVKPAFFIDDKPDLPRVFSTIRDPNSLGAFLVLPVTILAAAWFRLKNARVLIGGLLLLHGLVLFLTFSRTALLATGVSVILVLFWQYKKPTLGFIRKFWPVLVISFVLLAVGIFLARDNYVVQNVVFHSDENTRQVDSNNKHLQFIERGIRDTIQRPIGYGPGTAGLVSIQTKKDVIIENYFVQISYEIGLLGLLLLMYIMYLVVKKLYQRQDFYAQVMICAFIGLTLYNLFLHTWANEAVAAQWWLLAGFLLNIKAK